jgi:light-regulated signal transduction histidine kinase (bacteriophytochrome)
MTGFAVVQVVGRTIRELIPQIEPFWIQTYDQVVRKCQSIRFESPVAALGKHFETLAWSTEENQFAMIFNDITERKRMQESLLLRASDLAKANQDLHSAIHELEGFSYSIAHDLRGPLRTITSFTEIILEESYNVLDDESRDYLRRIKQSGIGMGQRIDELLDFSRIRNMRMRLTDVNLSSIAMDIINSLKKSEPHRVVDYANPVQISTCGDPFLLRRMLENLLRNAWVFTSKKTIAKIEFFETTLDGEQVFVVKDNGAGFDMEFKDRLYRPFSRLHTIEEFPGSGIGLSIVKRIIDRHNGRIWADAKVGEGATFYFTIPDKNITIEGTESQR